MRSLALLALAAVGVASSSCSAPKPQAPIVGKWQNTRAASKNDHIRFDGGGALTIEDTGQKNLPPLVGGYRFLDDQNVELTIDGKAAMEKSPGAAVMAPWMTVAMGTMILRGKAVEVTVQIAVTKDRLTLSFPGGEKEEYQRLP